MHDTYRYMSTEVFSLFNTPFPFPFPIPSLPAGCVQQPALHRGTAGDPEPRVDRVRRGGAALPEPRADGAPPAPLHRGVLDVHGEGAHQGSQTRFKTDGRTDSRVRLPKKLNRKIEL